MADPRQVQQGSGERFRRRFQEALLVQSQVRFNKVPEKVPGEGLGGFGAEPGQVQQGSGKGSREESGEGLGGFGAEPGQVEQGSVEGSGEGVGGFGAEPGWVQQGSGEGSREGSGAGRLWSTLRCFQRLASQHASKRFVKIKRCGCWGYHRSFFF